MQPVRYSYHSLEDFLISSELTVDGQVDDGWQAFFPVKGREIEATILFADITGFSIRTLDLSPTETLSFVNHFFTWIAAEALRHRPGGIVDKYIGDEAMIVFAKEFGSAEPFVDALQTAAAMSEPDVWNFRPHIGIASGPVVVGYVGTPIKYNASVFGKPVTVASRCANVAPRDDGGFLPPLSIVFPADEWKGQDLDQILPNTIGWSLLDPREVDVKHTHLTVREVVKQSINVIQDTQTGEGYSAEAYARDSIAKLAERGRYWPRS